MKLQRNHLLLLLLTVALTLPGCYTQLQTTQYQDSSDRELDYYADQKRSSYQDAPRRSSADVRLQYRNYQVADWYRSHNISPATSYNTYNYYNDFYGSPRYSSMWHDRFFTGFYHDPFYRPWRSGFRTYWSFSFGIGHGGYSYPMHGWNSWYSGYSPYGYYDRYSYYPYYSTGSQKVERDYRTGPRGSGVQRTGDRNRVDRTFNNRNDQGSGNKLRPTGTQSTVNKGDNSGRTRSADRDRNSRSRNRGDVNRSGDDGSSRSSGDRSRSSGRDGGRQSSSVQSYDSYKEALKANTTQRERAIQRHYRTSKSYDENTSYRENKSKNANYDRDQNRANRSYTRQSQPVQFKFNNNNRSSSTRSRSYMRNTSNSSRSHGTTNVNSQSNSSSNQRIQRSNSSGSRSSGNNSRSSSRSRSSGRDR